MASDPKFVRLHNRLARGMDVDLASGFGISGLDVVPFPKDPRQAEYVRDRIRQGVYEEASGDEVEAFRARETDFTETVENDGHQEGRIQQAAAEDRRNIEGSRGLGKESAAGYKADKARRKALLEAADQRASSAKGSDAKAEKAEAEAAQKAAEAEAARVAAEQQAAADAAAAAGGNKR